MPNRYFSQLNITADQVRLSGPEAHHLIHVMRAGIGAEVVLFDGTGGEFLARVVRIGRGVVELAVLSQEKVDRELATELAIGITLPKGDRQKWLVEKLVELGVTRLFPLVTERSVARPLPSALERLQRTVIEASKQCGRNHLMEIAAPQLWPAFVESTSGVEHRWLAHPAGEKAGEPGAGSGETATENAYRHPGPARQAGPTRSPGPIVLAIGPEGGFTDEEVGLAVAAGWQLVDLGPRILRIETAAILLASWAILERN
jgi:16S rRNA (uracil1498-N3)-methyltransferase